MDKDAWQPIETAPKDGTEVDLWMVSDDDSAGWRETECRWVRDYNETVIEYRSDGRYKYESRQRDGWWSYSKGYDGEGGFVDTPRHFNPHPNQRRDIFEEATHWMPLPEPPTNKED